MKNLYKKCAMVIAVCLSIFTYPASIAAQEGPNDPVSYFLKKEESASEINRVKNKMIADQTQVINKNSRGILGKDERTQLKYPVESIVYIRIKFEGISEVVNGTGFYIGDNKIATAGHALYNNGKKLEWASVYYSYVYEYPSNRVNVKAKQINVQSVYSPKEHVDTETKKYDYAVMVLDKKPMLDFPNPLSGAPLPSREMKHMSLAKADTNFQDKDLRVTGYPDTRLRPIVQHDGHHNVKQDGNRLYYDIDTEPGQSGSPVYYYDENTRGYVVAGIHVDGPVSYSPYPKLNSAVRVRKELFDFIMNPIPIIDKRIPLIRYPHLVHPYITPLEFHYKDGSKDRGSGFFISDKGHLMTVAHKMKNSQGSPCVKVEYTLYQKYSGLLIIPIKMDATKYTVYSGYEQNKIPENDFAVITTNKSTGFLNFWPRETGTIDNTWVRIRGYSLDNKEDILNLPLLEAEGHVLKTQANTFTFNTYTGNMDGAPIIVTRGQTGSFADNYFQSKGYYDKVLGMNITTENRGHNTALLFNSRIINWLRNNNFLGGGHDEL